MKKYAYILLTVFALSLISSSKETTQASQFRDTQSVIKALYIYTFATLIDWPPQYRKGNFEIAVFGEKAAVFNELEEKYAGKSIGSQQIVIKNYTSRSDIDKAHILYITKDKSQYIDYLASKFSSKSTLVIGEQPGALQKGAVINFIVEGNIQKYEINKKNAKKHDLFIAKKLSDLAANVIE